MNPSAIIRALAEARKHREYASLARFHEPRAVTEHIRRARSWIEAARAIRSIGGQHVELG